MDGEPLSPLPCLSPSTSPRKHKSSARKNTDLKTDSGSLLGSTIVEEEGDEDGRSPTKAQLHLGLSEANVQSIGKRAATEYHPGPTNLLSPHHRIGCNALRKTTGNMSLRQTPLQSPRPSSSMLSRFSVNTLVIRDATSRSTFWKHHSEMLSRLAKQFPAEYTVEGIPIGFVPSLAIMGMREEDTRRQSIASSGGAPDGTNDKSRTFTCDMVRKSSRASSRCSSQDSSVRNTHRSKSNSDDDDDSEDDENPPFDLPLWLAREDDGGDGEHEDGSGLSSALSDLSDGGG